MIRGCLNLAVASALCLLVGACSTSRPIVSSAGSAEIVQLNVLTAPVGLDLDGRPGLDGFSIRVFGTSATNPKPIPIRSGKLEVVMFDGTLFGRTNLPPPLHTWAFTAEELRQHEFKSRIGIGYDFLLPWGQDVPTRKIISVGARYTSNEGKILTSGLSSVTVIDRQERN